MDIFFLNNVEYLNMIGLLKQTCWTNEPELDGAKYLSQYIQLVLESLYIFTGFKNVVCSSYCHSSLRCKSYYNSVYDSLVSAVRHLTGRTPTFSKFQQS